MKYALTILLFLFVSPLFAQQNTTERPLIQFTGIITDVDSNTVVPYVTVTNLTNKGQRYAANYKGYFSFIAHPGDTLLYTAIGYKDLLLAIPSQINDSKYTAMVKMKAEIVNLPTVRVYPWATVEEFTRDFMSMKIADDDYVIAARNLSQESLSGLIQTLPRDGGEIQSINNRLNHDRALNKNMVQTNPLLNPFAWGKLMQSIFKGDKARSESN
ncbi:MULTISPECIES: hypothetical protein [Pedobacter]|uniref:Carboxypeptidase-like regulatory domain-containing protein n=1 Tax=Pedobacter heparinus (strain ATCC 13125 / DSM 2366 / CIP 104194 / JCM 7457 / NBRC 12017 / NCIMB 9290 / NRRL B-14731 / HIM 762-3) TaxID=485917 RepID=C6XXM0_PEDHD|nr:MULTISPECIES: hypothetical protein [Pedobacter]ACU02274.1 hypothetical protein Phep_0048 [Pedobacter heparinus DSM 2366]MBB5437103.1 hypothetical protein [Pedobacter sp. AK017]